MRGIDLAPNMVAVAREFARELGLATDAVAFAVGDIERLDEADASYAAIVCQSVLDFALRPGRALLEFWRVLRPGGRLVLSTLGAYSPVRYASWRRFLPDADGPIAANGILPWEVEALLRHLGWRLVAQVPDMGPTRVGIANHYTQADSDRLADPILPQTIATSWRFVTEKPAE